MPGAPSYAALRFAQPMDTGIAPPAESVVLYHSDGFTIPGVFRYWFSSTEYRLDFDGQPFYLSPWRIDYTPIAPCFRTAGGSDYAFGMSIPLTAE